MNKCIICLKVEGTTPIIKKSSQESLEKVRDFATKRASYGETVLSPLCNRIASLPEEQYFQSVYHYGCYQNVVHMNKLKRAEKRFRDSASSSQSVEPPKKGRPARMNSLLSSTQRLRRSTCASKIRNCVFQCPKASSGELHRVESDAMGRRLLFIKSRTQSEKVRISLANISEPSDCAALDLMYHRDCLREHERKIQSSSNSPVDIKSSTERYIADIDILNVVRCSLSAGSTLTMKDINEVYISLLEEHDVSPGTSNQKKHLKKIISENKDVKFVKSHRVYESEYLISEKLLGESVSSVCEHQIEEEDIKCISKAAAILRKEAVKSTSWKFTGSQSLLDFQSPPMLTSFLKWLVFGTKVRDVKGRRDESLTKSISLIAQHILQNFKTDRQATYQSLSHTTFKNRIETPLSVGLALTVHKKTRSKDLVDFLSQLQIGSPYDKVVNIEKRIACGVADRMKTTGGFYLPPFIVKGKSVYFATDNIDFLKNTADGQNTLHGTILVINQNSYNQEDSDDSTYTPVSEPLRIPDDIGSVDMCTNFIIPPTVVAKPINVDQFEFHLYDHLLRKYEMQDRAWFMATFFHRGKASVLNVSHLSEESTNPDDPEPFVTSSVLSGNSSEIASCLDKQPTLGAPDKIVKQDIMPTWAATNSVLIKSFPQKTQPKTNSAIVAPLLRKPPTDYTALYSALCLAQGISAFVVGPNHKTVITLDLDLYERALKLQSSTNNSNWILRVGELHACFASLHAIAKYIEDSGLESISIEAGLYSPATIRQIFTGKWFKRGVEFHMTNIMACYDLLFEASPEHPNMESMITKCHELRKKINAKDEDTAAIFEKIVGIFGEHFQATLEQNLGEMAQFLMNYMNQVESLLHLIRASRQGDWELHLAAVEEQIKYYFAHDLYKYATLLPVYLAQMQMLKKTDEETWNALKCGDFMVTKSGIPFTNLFVDQTLEQLIRELKVAGGITGITQNEDALDRFFLIGSVLVNLIQDFQIAFSTTGNSAQSSTKEHYQLSGSMALRMFNTSALIKESIVKHCEGNPFSDRSISLMNLVTNMAVTEVAKEDILNRDRKGTIKFEEYMTGRVVVTTANKSIWDPMKKMNLKTFNSCKKMTKCKVGNAIVKLREERQLLARFLVVQQSRPSMIESLSETVGKYEFSVIPRALFSSDGNLLIPSDKSAFIHAIEEYNVQSPNKESETGKICDISTKTDIRGNVCIIDAMAILQAIKKGPSMVTCSDLASTFVGSIRKIISGYDEGRVIFDRYVDYSLKNQTRGKRSAGIEPVKFDIKDITNIKLVPLKTLLSHNETKSKLTEYLGKALLHEYSNSSKQIVVVYGTSAYTNKQDIFDPNIVKHSHEEADTLIPLHVLDASKVRDHYHNIDVYSPDTDVFIYLMDLLSNYSISGELHFITGKGKANRTIDIRARCAAIGYQKSKGLLGLHAFSGSDWGGKFAGISKSRWIKNYLCLEPCSDIVYAFQTLGEDHFRLDEMTRLLENFVCIVYAHNSTCKTVKELRWELFRCKNFEAEKLPPTLGALKLHIQRANLVARIGKGYKEPNPHVPPLSENGWEMLPDETLSPKKCLELPAPQAVLELVKCGCRGECTSHCSCHKNDLPCTALCKCNDCGNTIDYKVVYEEDIK